MTKLAIVRQKYRPDGGAERFVSSALSALSDNQELDISVITREWLGAPNNDYKIVKCNPLKWGRISREKRFAHSASALFKHFDIVQSHERIPGCHIFRAGDGVHKMWVKHRSRILSPSEASRIENSAFHQYVMHAEKQMFEHANLKAVICNSEMVKKEITQCFEIDPSYIHVIYNAVDSEKFSPALSNIHRASVRSELSIANSTHTLLYVGSGFERKGLKSAILSVAKTRSHLIVVGKDKAEKDYYQLAESLNCADRIHFVGMQSAPERFYGAADSFIIPTLYDPFPNVALEAMSTGLPVITSYTCGASDIISNGKNGYVCDALDIDVMAQFITHLENEEHRLTLGQSARKTVLPLSKEKLSSELIALYQQVIRELK